MDMAMFSIFSPFPITQPSPSSVADRCSMVINGRCFTGLVCVSNTLGGDVFFTELYKIGEDGSAAWESDGGVSSYNPTVYEKQQITLPSGSSGR